MNKYILIIDPDLQELKRLRELLSKQGYNIMTATDYKTGQQICQHLKIDLVLAESRIFCQSENTTPVPPFNQAQ